ncbi:hypothetical protein M3J09_008253 [Ascochyta lentis]
MQSERAPIQKLAYYSAHRGLVWAPNGEFHHFARQCDPIHTMNGYWKFNSYDDDRRAYKCGLYTPEAVLIAQDVGDGVYDNITLRWVSGKLDPENRPTVGTAAAHLEAIYNERRILGKSLSFRGRVPLYSISTEQRLVNYRITRSGTQGDALSEEVLVSPSQHTFSSDTVSLIVASGGCTRSRTPLSVSAPASLHRAQDKSTLNDVQVDNSLYTANFQPTSDGIGASPASVPSRIPSPLAQANGNQSSESEKRGQLAVMPGLTVSKQQTSTAVSAQRSMESQTERQTPSLFHTLRAATSNSTLPLLSSVQATSRSALRIQSALAPTTTTPHSASPVRSSQIASDRQHIRSDSIAPTLLAQKSPRRTSSLDPRLRGRVRPTSACTVKSAETAFLSPTTTSGSLEDFNHTEGDEDYYVAQDGYDTANDLTYSVCSLSSTNLRPSQLYDAQSATLPCMSCGVVTTHATHCWIKEATLSLRAPDELAASNYRDLVADVKRFDPGPWTTHVGPPKEVAVDDPHTQVQGMAEMIRNLETSKEDPELQTLDAEFTVLLWALKSSGNVQIMKA